MEFFTSTEDSVEPDQGQYEEYECRCKKPDWRLEIDCGSVGISCGSCGNGVPESWGDWSELLCMGYIPVKLEWEKEPCSCGMNLDKISCDCDHYLIATPTPGAVKGEKSE